MFHIHSIPQTNLSVPTRFWNLKGHSLEVSEARKGGWFEFIWRRLFLEAVLNSSIDDCGSS